MTAKDVIKEIKKVGWSYSYSRGGHDYYTHPTIAGKITVPVHKGDIPRGTLHNILKQAGLK